MAHHLGQPTAELALLAVVIECVAVAEDLEHDLLDDFLRRVFRAALAPGVAIDHGPVAGEKLVPGERAAAVAKLLQEARMRSVRHTVILRFRG